jgi:hypothetical protein
MSYPSYIKAALKLLFALSFLMASCAPRMPVYIDDVWTTDPPVVGKIVTMGVRIKSVSDEDNLIFVLRFPDKFLVNENPLRWEFGLNANQEKVVYADICVLETGSWLIDVGIASYFDDGEFKYGDRRVIGILSYPSEEKVILEKDIVYSQAVETEKATISIETISPEECSY